jgi:GNAT superfamily N-acetyltransferase
MGRDRRHDLVVRDAAVADAPSLRMLLLDANAEFRDAMPARVFRNYLHNLVELVGDVPPDGMLVVESADGQLLGTGTVAADGRTLHAVDWPAGHAVFRAMAVAPAARGTGAGSVIGRALLDRAAARGARAVGLHTGTFMVDAQRLYERLGFRRVPERDLRIDDIFGPAGEPYDDPAQAYWLELAS